MLLFFVQGAARKGEEVLRELGKWGNCVQVMRGLLRKGRMAWRLVAPMLCPCN